MNNSTFLMICSVGTLLFAIFQDDVRYMAFCAGLALFMTITSLVCESIEKLREKLSKIEK